jgi:hypothetical protein
MIEIFFTYIPALLVFIALIGVAEFVANVSWWRIYFSFGIPLYKRTIQVRAPEMNIPTTDDIEEYAISDNARHRPILVRQIAENSYGFRETFFPCIPFSFTYMPVMHGYIHFDHQNNKIEIKGLVNWYISAFSFLVLAFASLGAAESNDFSFLAFPILLLVYIGTGIMSQQKRYDQLVEILEKLWS